MRPFVVALVAVVGACSAELPSATAGAPDPCASVARLQVVVVAFLTDYNAGRTGLADRFFAPEPAFEWYSERTLRQGSAAFERSTLESYLQQRRADGDMLTLVTLEMNFVRDGVGNFGSVFKRGSVEIQSKGAIDCRSGKFIVWSLGPDPGP